MADINNLLESVERAMHHASEIEKLKGESFNVFRILKIEYNENKTHSAFIGELLNPNGTHLKGGVFLKLFLESFGQKYSFDTKSAFLTLEKNIGRRNDKAKSGGRVDIYLADNQNKSICIENKIHAEDQTSQIERYCNHNSPNNWVIYLTLDGSSASNSSSGVLERGLDYTCLSYKKDIIQWLQKCVKESTDQPILRETIRQYIILINKITNQLTDATMENEIEDLIAKHYNAAALIGDNIAKVEQKATENLLKGVRDSVQDELGNTWTITLDEDLSKSWSGLTITHNEWSGLAIKLEGNSKMPWSNNYYGIIGHQRLYDRNLVMNALAGTRFLEGGARQSEHWPCYKYILPLATSNDRKLLFNPFDRQRLLKEISESLIEFALETQDPLSKIPRIQI